MPNINVEISEGLMRAVRIRCAEEGLTQKDFVLRALVRDAGEVEALNDGTGAGNVRAGVAESVGQEAGKPRGRKPAAKPGRSTKGTTAGDRGPDNRPVERDQSNPKSDSLRSGHDTKNCRIYRCGQCSALGVKNPIRGLK